MAPNNFIFDTGLRGYHVYRDQWKPYISQPINFDQENDNIHDNFAVAGSGLLPRAQNVTIVGHIPRELSRYIWFALELGAKVTGTVKSDRHRPSPLLQGGLEIPVTVKVKWEDGRKLNILKEKVSSVGYSMEEPYKDDSEVILKKILVDRNQDEQDDLSNDDISYGNDENAVESEEEGIKKKKFARIQISSDEED